MALAGIYSVIYHTRQQKNWGIQIYKDIVSLLITIYVESLPNMTNPYHFVVEWYFRGNDIALMNDRLKRVCDELLKGWVLWLRDVLLISMINYFHEPRRWFSENMFYVWRNGLSAFRYDIYSWRIDGSDIGESSRWLW